MGSGQPGMAQFQYLAPFPVAISRDRFLSLSAPVLRSARGERSEVGLEPLCVAGLERWRIVGKKKDKKALKYPEIS